MIYGGIACLAGAVVLGAAALAAGAPSGGRFVKEVWAPIRGNEFRVNGPFIPPQFRERPEGKQTGVMRLTLDEDPAAAVGAELYLELWGGHPGVCKKQVTLNGGGTYDLPEVGTERHECTYSYPSVPLDRADLRRGENVLAFTCDSFNTFWAHYLIRAAAIRLTLPPAHPTVQAAGLQGFAAAVATRPKVDQPEVLELSLDAPPEVLARIARVDYWGHYRGYDENGNRSSTDWHGFTKDREPVGILGSATEAPFAATWDLSMVPDQDAVGVRAAVRLKEQPGLSYETPAVRVPMPRARDDAARPEALRGRSVELIYAEEVPRPFWSRAGRRQTCMLKLAHDPASIERAELRVLLWDGGRGKTADPFALNGHALDVAGTGRHDVLYRVVPVDPGSLRQGDNEIALLSDTEHHGIEVLAPGPALIVRVRTNR